MRDSRECAGCEVGEQDLWNYGKGDEKGSTNWNRKRTTDFLDDWNLLVDSNGSETRAILAAGFGTSLLYCSNYTRTECTTYADERTGNAVQNVMLVSLNRMIQIN